MTLCGQLEQLMRRKKVCDSLLFNKVCIAQGVAILSILAYTEADQYIQKE